MVGSPAISSELSRRFGTERTSLGEPISVVPIDKSDGVVVRDEAFLQHVREAAIKEYFYGDSRRTLSPLIQQVDFDNVVVYRTSDGTSPCPPYGKYLLTAIQNILILTRVLHGKTHVRRCSTGRLL